jgi:acyl carrier protein
MNESSNEIAGRIETFIRDHFSVEADDDFFGRDVHLWEEGYVDSTGVVELIAFLEESFAIKMPDDALFDPEFTTIDGMSRMVDRLRAA